MTVHRTHPPTRAMRDNPDIDQLKRQARELLEAYRTHSPDAIIEVAAHHRTATLETFALHDAHFVLARSYGFESWPKLKAAVDGVTTTRLHEAVQKGDLGRLEMSFRSLTARAVQSQCLDQRRQRGGLLPPARIVQKVAGERFAPVFEHANQCAAGEMWGGLLLHQERQPDAINGRANQ